MYNTVIQNSPGSLEHKSLVNGVSQKMKKNAKVFFGIFLCTFEMT
jgi:hypothetical protein